MGKSTVMSLRMIQCGRQTVDVIQPNGQARQMLLPLKVSDLLLLYPHHFVAHAGTTKRGSMLPLETQLETGNTYVLLPLPRIFPSSSSSSLSPLDAPPPPCSCFLQMQQQGSSITSRMMSSMIMIMGGADPTDSSTDGTSKPKLKQRIKAALTSLQQPSSKISPDESSCSSSSSSLFGGRDKAACHPRRLWEPALDVIMEDKVLMRTKEEEAEAIRSRKDKKKAAVKPVQQLEPSSSIICRAGRMFG